MLYFLVISVFVYAQHINADKVPATVKTSFSKAHPGVTAKWEKEAGNYEVSFKESGNDMSCVIDQQGSILETETDMAVSKLPATITNYIHQHYKGSKIKEAAKIVKANGEINYEAEVGGKDLLFDSSGKFLKEEKG
ncbi:hypothetical protein SY85_24885 [Flavisolibacter tropicus]|uniref:Putative beta-lactamase-inhibitor-like PepSY-like domain-containing protein n=2 Tax=Flavisolibacter tropicus TaxID=1492898 RepID=A0A172U307_9BACT|nr:hypothetical protein SY85_24885 [Flavisolibacter tropicus]